MPIRQYLLVLLFFFSSFTLFAQNKFTLSGTIRDASSGETLIGATIKISGTISAGTQTNNYGYFALTQSEGNYTVTISYLGFIPVTKNINLNKDTKLNVELLVGNDLGGIVIRAKDRKNENVKSAQMGLEKIDMKALNSIPVLLGEK
ncbi:MAG: carboxypeptidase-like regulatory domain-containing protein, partial [Pedobacter sp.]